MEEKKANMYKYGFFIILILMILSFISSIGKENSSYTNCSMSLCPKTNCSELEDTNECSADNCPKCDCVEPEEKECPKLPEIEEKALLDVETFAWGINEYDTSEFIFDYWVNNYGDAESKNIKIRCKLYNEKDGTIFSEVHDFGNIASYTTTLGEITPKKTLAKNYNKDKEYSGYCFIESCDNCEILYKRIPQKIISYESDD